MMEAERRRRRKTLKRQSASVRAVTGIGVPWETEKPKSFWRAEMFSCFQTEKQYSDSNAFIGQECKT